MDTHPLAGKPAPASMLENIPRLVSAYYSYQPDASQPGQLVSFGTSGHRGSSLRMSFNQAHILAITQAICDYRKDQGQGPLFLGMDTHALSEAAHTTAIEVLIANAVDVHVARDFEFTPTPVVSHAILDYNRERRQGPADGIVITPSHNPPEDGGFKYNPPHGGPADDSVTRLIQQRANELLASQDGIERVPISRALRSDHFHFHDFITPYVEALGQVVNMEVIRSSGLNIGIDPMGGAGLNFWDPIGEHYKLKLTVVNQQLDPSFRFMTLDRDGKIRMDCSSPYAMARLIELKDRYDIAFGNDPDFDRHGIVTASGLMNPNHFLSVAIWYLFRNRERWRENKAVGKTIVSSSMIDRVTAEMGRRLVEVPVGFKWFVDGLLGGQFGFAGEESAGASYLRKSGEVWTTDKDGFILDLLAAEITAATEKDPSQHYLDLCEKFGNPVYERIDAPASPAQKAALKRLSPEMIDASELAGDPITNKLTRAPGNGVSLGGLKVMTAEGWFAARPSGTEDVYKIYAESFRSPQHLRKIQEEAQALVSRVLSGAGAH